MDEEERRISAVIGVSEEGLSEVNMETLRIYYDFLKEHLKFPFKANFEQERRSFQTQTHHVNCLHLDEVIKVDDKYGILVEGRIGKKKTISALAELEVDKNSENHQLIEDYRFWFWNQ